VDQEEAWNVGESEFRILGNSRISFDRLSVTTLALIVVVLLWAIVGGIAVVSANSGDLVVYGEGESGNSLSGLSIALYDEDWNHIETKTTNSNGKVYWSDIESGTYYLELYNGSEFWASGSANVESGSTTTTTLQRAEPYHTRTDLTDQGDGDGNYEAGETVTISPNVYNDKSYSRDVRVHIYVDTDNDGSAEKSVTRGPVTISGDDDQWYGYDFTPETSGTHQVRVEVETYVANSWILTDDAGWHKQFNVESDAGELEVTTEDRNGNTVSGAEVVLYDDNWNQVDSKRTGSHGKVQWSGLDSGTYNLELYDGGEFWASGSANVESGSTTTTTLQRAEPYHTRTDLTDQGDGDGTYKVGETVTISPNVYNDKSYSRDVRVRIYVDADNDGSAEESVTRGPVTVGGDDDQWYGYDFTPETSGTHQVRVEVETYVANSWILTDDAGWHKQFDVESDAGELEVTAKGRDGSTISGADVVLYDNDWNRLDSKTTDSNGQVAWSGLDSGTYNLELYDDGELWTSGSTDIKSGSTTSMTLRRAEPYHRTTELTDEGNGDGTFEAGEVINISPNIYNDKSYSQEVRVKISIDVDDDRVAEKSVTRGPVTVTGDDDQWYGYDYTPETNGTHHVRVRVETSVDNSWVLTDDTQWGTEFAVESATNNLSISVSAPQDEPAGVAVSLYQGDDQIDETLTDGDGIASFGQQEFDTYWVEIKKDGQYWGGTSTEFNGNQISVTRYEPYGQHVTVSPDGSETTDGTYRVNQSLQLSETVVNGDGDARTVKSVFLIDSDGDSESDRTFETDTANVDANEDAVVTDAFAPQTNGTYRVRARTFARIDGDWVRTDDTGWNTSFTVEDTDVNATIETEVMNGLGDVIEAAGGLRIEQGANLTFAVTAEGTDWDSPVHSWYLVPADEEGDTKELASASGATAAHTHRFTEPGKYEMVLETHDGGDSEGISYKRSWTVIVKPDQMENTSGVDITVLKGGDSPTDADISVGTVGDAAYNQDETGAGQHALRGLEPGEYIVYAEADGNRRTQRVNLTANETKQLTFEFSVEPGSLSGVLKTPEGTVIEGATIEINGRQTQTDDEGRYSFESLPQGEYALMVRADGRIIESKTLEVRGDDSTADIVVPIDEGAEQALDALGEYYMESRRNTAAGALYGEYGIENPDSPLLLGANTKSANYYVGWITPTLVPGINSIPDTRDCFVMSGDTKWDAADCGFAAASAVCSLGVVPPAAPASAVFDFGQSLARGAKITAQFLKHAPKTVYDEVGKFIWRTLGDDRAPRFVNRMSESSRVSDEAVEGVKKGGNSYQAQRLRKAGFDEGQISELRKGGYSVEAAAELVEDLGYSPDKVIEVTRSLGQYGVELRHFRDGVKAVSRFSEDIGSADGLTEAYTAIYVSKRTGRPVKATDSLPDGNQIKSPVKTKGKRDLDLVIFQNGQAARAGEVKNTKSFNSKKLENDQSKKLKHWKKFADTRGSHFTKEGAKKENLIYYLPKGSKVSVKNSDDVPRHVQKYGTPRQSRRPLTREQLERIEFIDLEKDQIKDLYDLLQAFGHI